MNAQEKWKLYYINFCRSILFKIGIKSVDHWRMEMFNCRREAALERKLEAAQRRIAELERETTYFQSTDYAVDCAMSRSVDDFDAGY